MHSTVLIASVVCALIAINYCVADQFEDDDIGMAKRAAMRNALVRLGRSTGMRNALVRSALIFITNYFRFLDSANAQIPSSS
jgi:hypothetical protein